MLFFEECPRAFDSGEKRFNGSAVDKKVDHSSWSLKIEASGDWLLRLKLKNVHYGEIGSGSNCIDFKCGT